MIATKIIVTLPRRKWSASCVPTCLGRAQTPAQTGSPDQTLTQNTRSGLREVSVLTKVLAALNRTLYSQAPAQHLHLAIFKGHCSDHRPSPTWSSPRLPLSGAPSAAFPGQGPHIILARFSSQPIQPTFLLCFILQVFVDVCPPLWLSSSTSQSILCDRVPSPLQTASPQSAPPFQLG